MEEQSIEGIIIEDPMLWLNYTIEERAEQMVNYFKNNLPKIVQVSKQSNMFDI